MSGLLFWQLAGLISLTGFWAAVVKSVDHGKRP